MEKLQTCIFFKIKMYIKLQKFDLLNNRSKQKTKLHLGNPKLVTKHLMAFKSCTSVV